MSVTINTSTTYQLNVVGTKTTIGELREFVAQTSALESASTVDLLIGLNDMPGVISVVIPNVQALDPDTLAN